MAIYLPWGQPATRRIRRLQIQASLILELFRGLDGTRLIEASVIPADAKIVGISLDEGPNIISLYLESQEFQEVNESIWYPDMDSIFFVGYEPDIIAPDKLLFTVGPDVVARQQQRIEALINNITAGQLARRQPDY